MSHRPAFIDLDEDHRELREPVSALCARYPGEYWREKDRARAYPEEFVQALTDAGFLAALIPERYGGSGLGIGAGAAILEEIHASGCNGGACHAQMYTMGTVLRHGSDAQKETYLPQIASGARRLQAFGVTEPTTGSDTTQLRTTAERRAGRRLHSERPEGLDLAGRALGPAAAARPHHAEGRDRRSAPRACRSSSSSWSRRWARASRSGRSAP